MGISAEPPGSVSPERKRGDASSDESDDGDILAHPRRRRPENLTTKEVFGEMPDSSTDDDAGEYFMSRRGPGVDRAAQRRASAEEARIVDAALRAKRSPASDVLDAVRRAEQHGRQALAEGESGSDGIDFVDVESTQQQPQRSRSPPYEPRLIKGRPQSDASEDPSRQRRRSSFVDAASSVVRRPARASSLEGRFAWQSGDEGGAGSAGSATEEEAPLLRARDARFAASQAAEDARRARVKEVLAAAVSVVRAQLGGAAGAQARLPAAAVTLGVQGEAAIRLAAPAVPSLSESVSPGTAGSAGDALLAAASATSPATRTGGRSGVVSDLRALAAAVGLSTKDFKDGVGSLALIEAKRRVADARRRAAGAAASAQAKGADGAGSIGTGDDEWEEGDGSDSSHGSSDGDSDSDSPKPRRRLSLDEMDSYRGVPLPDIPLPPVRSRVAAACRAGCV